MAGFGGSPGLAILAGVAKGINDEQVRQQEAMRRAILNRLAEVQIEQTEQAIAHAAAREARSAREAAEKAESDAAAYEELVESYLQKGMTRAEAHRKARARQSENYVDPELDEQKRKKAEAEVESVKAQAEQRRAAANTERAQARAADALARKRDRESAGEGGGTVPKSKRELIAVQMQRAAEEEVAKYLQLLRSHAKGNTTDEQLRTIAAQQALMAIKRDIALAEQQGLLDNPEALLEAQELLRAIERITGEVVASNVGRKSERQF